MNPGNTNGTNGGYNAGVEFGGGDFGFSVKDRGSIISIEADWGAAINAYTQNTGFITVGKGAIFVARGRTLANDSAIFRASGGSVTTTITNPLYYDFRNDNQAGLIFNTGSSTFISNESDLAVWRRSLDPHSGDPYRSWTLIDYELRGTNLNTIYSTNVPAEFNTSASSYGNAGVTAYSRMNGNNANATITNGEITNADKYVRFSGKVPEGVASVPREIWTNEVWGTITSTQALSSPTTSTYSSVDGAGNRLSSFRSENVWLAQTGTTLDGVFRYTPELAPAQSGFLRTGDSYKLDAAYRASTASDAPD
jgi:hypothetical protein